VRSILTEHCSESTTHRPSIKDGRWVLPFRGSFVHSREVLGHLENPGTKLRGIKYFDLIAEADWVIDLGPEGGDGGGRIVAEGTPEAVAREPKSHTGRFLSSLLKQT